MESAAPQQLGTSANPRICQVTNCARRVSYWLPSGPVRYSLLHALFDNPGDLVAVCKPCYKMLHRADGITLGYRMSKGQLTAYVKDVHY